MLARILAISGAAILIGCTSGNVVVESLNSSSPPTSPPSSPVAGPSFSISTPSQVTNSNSVSWSGVCEDGLSISITGADGGTTTCSAGVWSYSVNSQTTDALRSYVFSQTNAGGGTTSATGDWTRDTTAPAFTAGSFLINGGATATANPNVAIGFQANDAGSPISHFCLKADSTSAPSPTDPCWIPVDAPVPGLAQTKNLSVSSFNLLLSPSAGVKNVYGWLRDSLGNATTLSTAGSGTALLDKDSITIDLSQPPSVEGFLVSNTSTPGQPPAATELIFSAAQNVYVKWRVTDDEALGPTPVSLAYSTNGVSFVSLATGLSNGANGCLANEVGTTADDAMTGCYLWASGAPSGGFWIRIAVVDSDGQIHQFTSAQINSGIIVHAGRSDDGLNSDARIAYFYSDKTFTYNTDSQSFVVTSNGTVFFRDIQRGILKVDPADKIQTLFIPTTGTASGDGGSASSASLRSPSKIALDFQNGLLIFDYDRVRRVDLNTNIISTYLGGGTDTADSTTASSLQFESIFGPSSWQNLGFTFMPLPNGKIYFKSEKYSGFSPQSGSRLRLFDPGTGQVTSIYPSGIGRYSTSAPYVDTADLSECNFDRSHLGFDPRTSLVNGLFIYANSGSGTCSSGRAFANLSPLTYLSSTPHPPAPTSFPEDQTPLQARNGGIYAADKYTFALRRFDTVSNSWTTILGSGQGYCADGTLATACPNRILDAYVSDAGQVYFIDDGQIRYIQSDGKVMTLYGMRLSAEPAHPAFNTFTKLSTFDQKNNSDVVIFDEAAIKFKEFPLNGNITVIAGNGLSGMPNTSSPATTQPIHFYQYSAHMPFKVNPISGDVYYQRYYNYLARLDRATGLWTDIAGGGATDYSVGDGSNSIALNGYESLRVIGFNGSQVLIAKSNWVSPNYVNSMLKLYDVFSGIQSGLAGVLGIASWSDTYCSDGVAGNACTVPLSTSLYGYAQASYDSGSGSWLLLKPYTPEIRKIAPGGNMGTLTSLDYYAVGFAHKAAPETIYYCGTTGLLRKVEYSGGIWTESNLPLPSGWSCHGQSVKYNPSRNSVFFVWNKGIYFGIAEYPNP